MRRKNLDSTAQVRIVTNAADIKIHSQFNPKTLNNDISVIRLASPLILNHFVWPVQLARRADVGNTFEGQKGVTSGWGKISDSENYVINELRFVNMVVENHSVCKKYYLDGLIIDGTLCLNTAQGYKGVCNGDSGGPFVIDHRLVGVTSFVPSTGCENGGPDGFTFVPYYLDWIMQNTGLPV